MHFNLQRRKSDFLKRGLAVKGLINSILNFQNHNKLCEFSVVKCENEECQEKAERGRIQEHHQICQFRPIECEYCNQTVATSRYEVCYF